VNYATNVHFLRYEDITLLLWNCYRRLYEWNSFFQAYNVPFSCEETISSMLRNC